VREILDAFDTWLFLPPPSAFQPKWAVTRNGLWTFGPVTRGIVSDGNNTTRYRRCHPPPGCGQVGLPQLAGRCHLVCHWQLCPAQPDFCAERDLMLSVSSMGKRRRLSSISRHDTTVSRSGTLPICPFLAEWEISAPPSLPRALYAVDDGSWSAADPLSPPDPTSHTPPTPFAFLTPAHYSRIRPLVTHYQHAILCGPARHRF